ncbi:MAG: hypothetical protein PHP92_05575 [Candidatus Nanoarchaeia archaeon]|nr:hypothetical protein [Candidatus Nanoarchaeia archaeon]
MPYYNARIRPNKIIIINKSQHFNCFTDNDLPCYYWIIGTKA